MDAIADLQTGSEEPAISDGPSTAPPADGAQAGKGGSPFLTLNGFTGPLDHLLTLARAQKIDIAAISLTALIDQLATALHHAPAATSLGEKADWVVMAAWLVQLRPPACCCRRTRQAGMRPPQRRISSADASSHWKKFRRWRCGWSDGRN